MLTPVERSARGVRMIDQRKLPLDETWVEATDPEQVAEAIRAMVVRGAPAIGIAAAFGMALAASGATALPPAAFDERLARVAARLEAARPTAVNLGWAVRRLQAVAATARAGGADNRTVAERLEREAQALWDEDLAACRSIGRRGAALVHDGATILTHCNAGGLATAGYGTALGVVRGAIESGKRVRVLAGETRPFLQGARLTAWELMRDDIETVLITDASAGSLMAAGQVDLVVVGADRIAANGDLANKIGTYPLAVLAREHRLPFYVAAPLSTVDPHCRDGRSIPIEEREAREVTEPFGVRVAPAGVAVRNPAFDVTPARLVSAIITEGGIARAPYAASLAALLAEARARP
jgi:methylthioribose-1-phosphate isomerase